MKNVYLFCKCMLVKNIHFKIIQSNKKRFHTAKFPSAVLVENLCKLNIASYQSNSNKEDLDNISVGNRNEAPKKSVAKSDDCGHDDGDLLVEVENNLQC